MAGVETNSNKVSTAQIALRAQVSVERDPEPVTQTNQFDPATLARIALEEELKKRGGGGGSAPSYNPNVWVGYSFTELAKAIEAARKELDRALSQSEQLGSTLINIVNDALQGSLKQGSTLGNLLNNILVTIPKDLGLALRRSLENPIAMADRMVTNTMQSAMTILSAITSGLKKIFYGKNEELRDPDEELYDDETLMTKLFKKFFSQMK